ncbi:unnamed protein product [Bursaphelenchus xylophilus]|uniref:(pine wood nematode) hypothetical protein n=1 Tax=Bursaphelenchus xylophilus TaxID=6326 RepID=A0A1I7SEF1_BURXY|nr:unnamed protein product [Bursaphelenchus xylophilus]CAG9104014.1 unnamed protein product [Bursaphelenchus xylophilus]
MKVSGLVQALFVLLVIALAQAQPLVYRPYGLHNVGIPVSTYRHAKRSNAELINGLIGMDLNTLQAVGKRSNAELINGLIGMDLNRLSSIGRRR